MLERQKFKEPPKVFSIKTPKSLYNNLRSYALSRQHTLSATVTHLLEKAMDAEHGEAYKPDYLQAKQPNKNKEESHEPSNETTT